MAARCIHTNLYFLMQRNQDSSGVRLLEGYQSPIWSHTRPFKQNTMTCQSQTRFRSTACLLQCVEISFKKLEESVQEGFRRKVPWCPLPPAAPTGLPSELLRPTVGHISSPSDTWTVGAKGGWCNRMMWDDFPNDPAELNYGKLFL